MSKSHNHQESLTNRDLDSAQKSAVRKKMNSAKKRVRNFCFLLAIACIPFSSQIQASSESTVDPNPFFQNVPFWFNDVGESLKARFDKDRLYFKTDKDRQLHDFYKGRNFRPIWLTRSGWGAGIETAIQVLRNAGSEGLDPADYEKRIQTFLSAEKETASLVAAEIALTDAVLDYIDDLGGERMSPRKIGKSLYIKPDPVDAAQILARGMASDQTAQWLQSLTVHKPQYQALKKILPAYRKKAQAEQNRPKLPKGPLLQKGKKHAQVPTLRKTLIVRGHSNLEPSDSLVFDETLEQAVKHFQTLSNIENDGIVGPQTRRALNKTAQEKVDQILATMERWRWLPEIFESRYVLVNIAAFDLKAYEDGQQKIEMPVIIGKQYRKTPVFTSSIYNIRFNPSWHVPQSIAVKDKLKKIKRDPSYLTRGGYVLYDSGGSRISPHDVNWSEVTSGSFHYRLRQRPGSHNALGKIRFSIKSPFNVYLHSTPDKHLFKKKVRSFSSGCIRVARPAELAYFVFDEPSKWTLQTISSEMEGTRTRNITLRNPVPVYIAYFTVWVDETGQPRFMDDLYGQDAEIIKVIKDRNHRARL